MKDVLTTLIADSFRSLGYVVDIDYYYRSSDITYLYVYRVCRFKSNSVNNLVALISISGDDNEISATNNTREINVNRADPELLGKLHRFITSQSFST